MTAPGTTLDAGALIAFERGNRRVTWLIARAAERSARIAVPAGALAQVWRDGARQARLSTLLRSEVVEVVPLDDRAARAVGQLLGVSGTTDVVDASVAWCARERGHVVVTSDPDDLRAVDPTVRVEVC